MANLSLIEKLSKENNLSLEHLADKARINYFTLTEMIATDEGSIADLEKIAAVLHVNPCIFFFNDEIKDRLETYVNINGMVVMANELLTEFLEETKKQSGQPPP